MTSEPVNITTEEPCSEDWPDAETFLNSRVTWETAMVAVGGALCLIALLLCTETSVYVWRQHREMKRAARLTIWILALSPALAVTSLMGMMIPRMHVFRDFLIISALSIAVLKFVRLVNAYYLSFENVRETVRAKQKLRTNVAPLLCCCVCLPQFDINKSNVQKMVWLVVQYPFVSIALHILTVVTWLDGTYQRGEWTANKPYPYLAVLKVCSTVTVIHGLNILVKPCMSAMKGLLLGPKYIFLRLCIVFFTFQGVIFSVLEKYTDLFEFPGLCNPTVTGHFYENSLLLFEMFLLTLLNRWSYRRILSSDSKTDTNSIDQDQDVKDELQELEVGLEDELSLEIIKDMEKNSQQPPTLPHLSEEKFINKDNKVHVVSHSNNHLIGQDNPAMTMDRYDDQDLGVRYPSCRL